MRLHFRLSPNTDIIPFDYQHKLIGSFHKWMGWNDIHDEISLYSLSWLQGGISTKNGLQFRNGANWFISFWDEEIGKTLMKGAMKEPETISGMNVTEIQIQETPDFSPKERFITASPVFIRKYDQDRKAIHLTPTDEDVDFYLTETLKNKLKKVNSEYEVEVKFDHDYPNPKTKLVNINGINNRACFCPVIIEGHPDTVKFAWNVGVGHLTGCGFGALY